MEDRIGVAGRVAVIAGGGGGLGRACGAELGRAGMRLGLCDRDAKLLDETCAMLADEGVAIESAVIDVRDPDALAGFFDTVDGTFGPQLHVLVNVVGGTFHQPFEASNTRGWDAVIRTNYTWLLHAVQLAIPRMRAAGGGSIINFRSIEGHRAAPGFAVYSGTKAAIVNASRSLALELAVDRIRINNIAADHTPTEGTATIITEGMADMIVDDSLAELTYRIAVPMGRRGTYPDIGGCALLLASDLSRYITGESLHPDGGAHASSGWFNWPDVGWRNTPPPSALGAWIDDGGAVGAGTGSDHR